MFKKFLKDTVVIAFLALGIFVLFQAVLLQIVVEQTSMVPTLQEKQRIYVSKVSYVFAEPARGDIVIFNPIDSPGSIPLIKRIVGLPGETIKIESGRVYINGKPLNEPYILEAPRYTMAAETIPDNQYFVLGDNRNNSRDSHEGWFVPEEQIIGKAWFSIWPPEKWGLVSNYAYADN